jgi:hypothetical protein
MRHHDIFTPTRAMRGGVIAPGSSHALPDVVVNVCGSFVLKMLYTSKKPPNRVRFTKNTFSARTSTSVMFAVRSAPNQQVGRRV